MLITSRKSSLENIDRKSTDLSKLQFDGIDRPLIERLIEQKILQGRLLYSRKGSRPGFICAGDIANSCHT